jgi:hypothetical protein
MKANQRKTCNRPALLGLFGLVVLLLVTGSAWANAVSEPEPFVCTGEAFSVRGDPVQGQLFLIDQSVSPFVFTRIGPGATCPAGLGCTEGDPIQVNNLGYRSTDNLLYAIAMPLSGNFNYGIIQIDSTGAVFPFTGLTGTPLPTARLLAGDITPDGNTFYINTYPSSTLYIVDLVTKNVTTQGLSGAKGGTVYVADWATNPDNGKLYGAEGVNAGSTYAPIYELDPTTGVITNLGEATNLPVNGSGPAAFYGGCWFNFAGDFFVYRNNDWIYEIDLSGPTVADDFTGSAISSSLNDAAACAEEVIEKRPGEGNPDEVGIYETSATQLSFTINYNGPEAKILDLVPAEFEVLENGCVGDGQSIGVFVYPDCEFKNPKLAKNCATIIEWDVGAGFSSLECTVETRMSMGNKKVTVYKPTTCEELWLNDGATAYEVDEFGNLVPISDTSNDLLVTAVAGTKPCAPQGLTVDYVSPDTLSLNWDDNEETVDHYNVYRGPSGGPFTKIAETTVSNFDDTGLAPGTYCYQIKAAFDEDDLNEGNESETECGTVPIPTP